MLFGIFGFFRRGGVTSSPVIRRSRSARDGASYGSTPVSIWYMVTPSEYRSEANTALPANCSGAMYGGLPMTVVPCAAISRKRDVPKSATFNMPLSETSTFDGRRSRCSTPW